MKNQQEEKKVDKKSNDNNSSQKDPVQTDNSNVLDFVNEIKNTAMMNAYEQAGFVYEPTSGLYW